MGRPRPGKSGSSTRGAIVAPRTRTTSPGPSRGLSPQEVVHFGGDVFERGDRAGASGDPDPPGRAVAHPRGNLPKCLLQKALRAIRPTRGPTPAAGDERVRAVVWARRPVT